ncbi:BREX-1 system adenine-specific DNA-methyltransferase PglX [Ureibacillus chungkukjangi]|uniref:site-specific DNA-methyltransferase (adenine-specific) n=1 Tax=Ureibacillus chungkukjangi TaxID=1202712 RepID=A0A318TRI4_9BACL|nr:BREX-1 system adenine-specific DNA-methyltransferase PglX [Ureibacillus chungkukjangi]PYF05648.1 Eco57I restriction-modification methylase [Ureibacillus chungkukjangi]
MNKTELKNFAIQSRRQLIEQVKTKALMYGIDEKNDLEIKEQFGQLMINDKPYPLYMKPAFNSLKNQLKQKAYKQLVEEVAYTWFNRIIAIRYMEVHDYLPEKVNVLSSSVGRVDPDILFEYETMDLPIKQEEIRELLDTGDTEGAYRKLFIAQCNTLNSILPFLFERIQNYTELLLPDFLLDAESVIKVLVQNDELTNSFDEIEVIGWLYQYYNSEPKDKIFADLKKNKKIEKYNIPSATQIFTPKWIVRYMVENSLGQIIKDNNLPVKERSMPYYIELEENMDLEKNIKDQNFDISRIRLIDPCMGSGHILLYAFDLLFDLYAEMGYFNRDIPKLIIENNLYGFEIDIRAYQLASFSLMMKGRSIHRAFLKEPVNLNLRLIQDINLKNKTKIFELLEVDDQNIEAVDGIIEMFKDASMFGSLVIPPEMDYDSYIDKLNNFNTKQEQLSFTDLDLIEDIQKVTEILNVARLLSGKYDVVITNPPYLALKGMNKDLVNYAKNYYPDSKNDLFSMFIERCMFFAKREAYISIITMESWMFLSSFEVIRKRILKETTICNMLHMPYEGKGRTSLGINFGTVATILKNYHIEGYVSNFNCIRYDEIDDEGIPYKFPSRNNRNTKINIEKLKSIPGIPIAYWTPDNLYDIFLNAPKLSDIALAKVGVQTGDNEKFIRYWYEVEKDNIQFDINLESKRWVPCSKGGPFCKWFGNQLYVIDWKDNGLAIKNHKSSVVRNEEYYRKDGLVFSNITSGKFSIRTHIKKAIFDQTSPLILFEDTKIQNYVLGLLNSNVMDVISEILSPTMHFNVGEIVNYPIIISKENIDKVNLLVEQLFTIAKDEYYKNELSWYFDSHPYLNYKEMKLLKNIDLQYKNEIVTTRIKSESFMRELNEVFMDLYRLKFEDIIEPTPLNKTINYTLIDCRSFLSYFIGCSFGRFELKGYNDTKSSILFSEKVYFENDIILSLRKFLAIAFSPDTVDENIQWLAEALEMKKGEDEEGRLRRYFLDEFFEDHCKTYQKRPIYWLVDSGKQKGLRTLIYMHRFQPDSMATIRFQHLQEIQAKYQNEITDLENRLVNPNLSASEKKKLTAEKSSFEKKIDELREFDKRLAEIANEEIEIDLDDGVKVNYEKFCRGGKGVLAKIK